MPVDTPHAEYRDHAPLWKKVRDCAAGEEVVKGEGEAYLPRLDGQDAAPVGYKQAGGGAYAAYKQRAMFYGATARTVQGLTGALLRKQPSIEWPEDDTGRLEALGHRGESLGGLLQLAADELLTVGRLGLLVDVPAGEGGDRPEPYVSTYFAENIVNWREEVWDGRRRLTMAVLEECTEVQDATDPFIIKDQVRYRVLRLGTAPAWANESDDPKKPDWRIAPGFTEAEANGAGFYFQELWIEQPGEDGARKTFVLVDRITPRRPGGGLWENIPFVILNPVGLGAGVHKPPLLDLVNVNLSHYRNSADLEHGLHYTALPTPYAIGFDTKKTTLRIGAGTAWVTDDANGKVGMLEFQGTGLKAIENQMDRKERLMATIGARLLEGQKKAQEAAAAILLRSAGEQSALANLADAMSEAFTRVLRWVRAWSRPTDAEAEIGVELAKDFEPSGMDPAQLQALTLALQSGTISWETYVYQLQVGEVLPEGVSADEEWDRIQRGLPAGMGVLLGDGTETREEEKEDPDVSS